MARVRFLARDSFVDSTHPNAVRTLLLLLDYDGRTGNRVDAEIWDFAHPASISAKLSERAPKLKHVWRDSWSSRVPRSSDAAWTVVPVLVLLPRAWNGSQAMTAFVTIHISLTDGETPPVREAQILWLHCK